MTRLRFWDGAGWEGSLVQWDFPIDLFFFHTYLRDVLNIEYFRSTLRKENNKNKRREVAR